VAAVSWGGCQATAAGHPGKPLGSRDL